MDIAKSSLFNYREASRQYRSKRHRMAKKGRALSSLSRLTALFNASWRDRYGLIHFDILIAGPDILLNLLLAHKAVNCGQTVAIYHGLSNCWESMDDLQRLRLNLHETSFTEVIESLLGFSERGMPEGVYRERPLADIKHPEKQHEELLKEIGFQTDRMWNSASSHLLSGCLLEDDPIGHERGRHRFIVREADHFEVYPSIDRLIFWAEGWQERFASLGKVKPQYAVEANEVWWTGLPIDMRIHKNEGTLNEKYYGEAKWPLSSFSQFVMNDRLRDIMHAIRDN